MLNKTTDELAKENKNDYYDLGTYQLNDKLNKGRDKHFIIKDLAEQQIKYLINHNKVKIHDFDGEFIPETIQIIRAHISPSQIKTFNVNTWFDAKCNINVRVGGVEVPFVLNVVHGFDKEQAGSVYYYRYNIRTHTDTYHLSEEVD